jgi:hypothetical protein
MKNTFGIRRLNVVYAGLQERHKRRVFGRQPSLPALAEDRETVAIPSQRFQQCQRVGN